MEVECALVVAWGSRGRATTSVEDVARRGNDLPARPWAKSSRGGGFALPRRRGFEGVIDPARGFLYLPTFPSPRATADRRSPPMRPPTATARWLLPIIACGIATAGCRLVGSGMLATDAATANRAATPAGSKPAPRTIHLEVLFIRCADDDPKFRDQLWNHVDEQALGDSLRRSLNANGMRVGIVTGDLPPEVADRLAAASADEAVGEIAGVDPALARRLLQVLPGRRSELVTATRLTNLVLLEQADGEVRGGTYAEATPQFAIEARPAADGRITLEAMPEIKHGPVEKSWVGEDGMFRLETGQRRHRMEHLGVDVTLPPGGMLLIGCAGQPSTTVGDGLLRDHGGGGDRGTMRLLVIRPLARSVDPVFASTTAGGDPSVE